MRFKIKNREALDAWTINQVQVEKQDLIGIKGTPPEGATDREGNLIDEINVAWKALPSGEVFNIEYEEVTS